MYCAQPCPQGARALSFYCWALPLCASVLHPKSRCPVKGFALEARAFKCQKPGDACRVQAEFTRCGQSPFFIEKCMLLIAPSQIRKGRAYKYLVHMNKSPSYHLHWDTVLLHSCGSDGGKTCIFKWAWIWHNIVLHTGLAIPLLKSAISRTIKYSLTTLTASCYWLLPGQQYYCLLANSSIVPVGGNFVMQFATGWLSAQTHWLSCWHSNYTFHYFK